MSTKKLQIVGSLGSDITIDSTLTHSGQAADAKVAGDAIANLSALVGDSPVSYQINEAISNIDSALSLDGMASLYRYLVFGFNGDDMQLCVHGSNDACATVTELAKNIYQPQLGRKTLRDPSAVWYQGNLYITYTIIDWASGTSNIGFCRTRDLINFEELEQLPTNNSVYANLPRCYAPQFCIMDGNLYIVSAAVGAGGTVTDKDGNVYSESKDDGWSIVWQGSVMVHKYLPEQHALQFIGLVDGVSSIDVQLFKHNNTYYAAGRGFKLYSSESMMGPYTLMWDQTQHDDSGVEIWYEGAFVLHLPNGKWRFFAQRPGKHYDYYDSVSSVLEDGFESAMKTCVMDSYDAMHFTVLDTVQMEGEIQSDIYIENRDGTDTIMGYAPTVALKDYTGPMDRLLTYDGALFQVNNGTTESNGLSRLKLGNNIPAGTEGNKTGELGLCSANGTNGLLVQEDHAAGSSTYVTSKLPKSGGLLLSDSNYSTYTVPRSGGTFTGNVAVDGGTTGTAYQIKRQFDDDQYQFDQTIQYDKAGLLKYAKNGSVVNRVSLYEDQTKFSRPINVEGGSSGDNAVQTRKNLGAASASDLTALSNLIGDTSVSDQINAAIEFATDDEIIAMLTELDAIPVLSDENGNIFTDETDTILLI